MHMKTVQPKRASNKGNNVREEVEEAEHLQERAQKGVAPQHEEDAQAEAGGGAELVLVEEEAHHAAGPEVQGQPQDEAQLNLHKVYLSYRLGICGEVLVLIEGKVYTHNTRAAEADQHGLIWTRTHVPEAQEVPLEEEGDAHHGQHQARAQQREPGPAERRGHGLVEAEPDAAQAAPPRCPAAAGGRGPGRWRPALCGSCVSRVV